MKKMKKLLVIIPYYNVEKHLEEAIEGILQQTFQNFHLVLIDDASTDNSRKIAERYKNNNKVSLLYNTKNKGCYYSVNKALKGRAGLQAGYIITANSVDFYVYG